MKKKILIVTRSMYKKGGVETALVNMINEIYRNYDIDLFAFSISEDYKKNLKDEVKIIKSNFWFEMLGNEQSIYKKTQISYYLRAALVMFCRIFSNKTIFSLIFKTLKFNEKYDLAISYMQAASEHVLCDGNNQFVLSNINAYKKFVVIHSDYEKEGFNNNYHNNLYVKFDKIIAVSNMCRDKIIYCVPEFNNMVSVMHNFYSIDSIKKLAVEFKPMYDCSKLNFVTVARLTEEKGILRMLNVIKLIDDSNFIWHIIGNGDLYSKIENQIKSNGLQNKVKLYGEKSNPYPYILNADLFILCSYYEAAPMVIGEAQILNTPVLTTKTLSSFEQIENGVTGFICENSEMGLLESVKYILNNQDLLDKISLNLKNGFNNNDKQLEEFNDILRNEGII